MNVQRNSVITIKQLASFQAGLYRVLEIYAEHDQICIFFLDGQGGTTKPKLVCLSHFKNAVENGNIHEGLDVLPPEMLYEDEELSASIKAHRDTAYEQIKALICNEEFLYRFASNGRSTLVVEHAKKIGVRPLVLYRSLRKYWKYGQVKNTLIKFTSNCGGRGKDKSVSSKQRGRPIDNGMYNLRTRRSINIGDEEKAQIKEAIQKSLKPGKRFRYKGAYDTYKELRVILC